MRVEIVAIEEQAGGGLRVEVASELGSFAAGWRGARPAVGARCHVELDLEEELTWGVNAHVVEPRAHAIARTERGGVVVWAAVERLDDDGYVGLRLGPSIVMTEIAGEPPPVGATVRLEARAATLSDTSI